MACGVRKKGIDLCLLGVIGTKPLKKRIVHRPLKRGGDKLSQSRRGGDSRYMKNTERGHHDRQATAASVSLRSGGFNRGRFRASTLHRKKNQNSNVHHRNQRSNITVGMGA